MACRPQISGVVEIQQVNSFTFGLFIYFNMDFFLHLSQRIPGYGSLRPTLLCVLILAMLLFMQRKQFTDVVVLEPFKRIKLLLVYLVLTLLIVRWPGSVLQNLSEFIKAVCFFFFAACILDSPKRIKIFVAVFVSCQIFRVLEPLYLHMTEGYWGGATHIGKGEFAGRLAGSPSDVINPNELGFVIATAVPFLYYLFWQGSATKKMLFISLMPLLLYALILTMSRGAFLALLVIGLIIFRRSQYKFFLICIALSAAVAGWSVMTDLQKDRYLSLVSSNSQNSGTAEGRLKGMLKELELGFTSRPVFGNGLGTTAEAKFHEWGRSQASHNLYAELLIEIGIFGAIIFLGFLRTLGLSLMYLREKIIDYESEGSYEYRLVMSLIAVFWMYLVYSSNYWGLSVYYWYLFGGLVVAISRSYSVGWDKNA